MGPIVASAQDFAPDSLAGSLLTVSVKQGSVPFATSGSRNEAKDQKDRFLTLQSQMATVF